MPVPEPRKGEVFFHVRANGRVPAEKFLADCEKKLRLQFLGSFGVSCRRGHEYYNHTRFKPLHGKGVPLWEFKEHDHRLYCVREFPRPDLMRIVLLNGWTKDKSKSRQELNEIETAQHLYREYLAEKGAVK